MTAPIGQKKSFWNFDDMASPTQEAFKKSFKTSLLGSIMHMRYHFEYVENNNKERKNC